MDMRTTRPSTNDTVLNAHALRRGGIHPDHSGLTGRGVVCCIIDYGFDLLHPALRHRDGTTRFAALIDQNGATLDEAQINRLIDKAGTTGERAPIDEVYDAHAHYFGQDGVVVGAHGTWVTSIAAGSRCARFSGVAPGVTLIGIQLALPDAAWRESGIEQVLGRAARRPSQPSRWLSYDESDAIADALAAGHAAALDLAPDGIIFNLSIGAWAGSHHAQARVNTALTELAACNSDADGPMTFVVAGTGNAGGDEGHFQATIAPGQSKTFTWRVSARLPTPEKLEIWADEAIEVLFRPTGSRSPIAPLHLTCARNGVQRLERAGQIVAVGEREDYRHGGLTCVHLLVAPDQAGGRDDDIDYAIEVHAGADNARICEIHAWVERNCSGPASRLLPAMRETTLTSLATAPGVISVAGLDTGGTGQEILPLSGRGPAPWGNHTDTPTLAAPAAGLWGARSKTTDFMRGSGTSGASAITAGAAALAIEAARRQGHRLQRADLIAMLLGASPARWSPEMGWGPLSFSSETGPPRRDAAAAPLHAGHHPHDHPTATAEGDRAP